jgi:hypothetical protein
MILENFAEFSLGKVRNVFSEFFLVKIRQNFRETRIKVLIQVKKKFEKRIPNL